jgi:hypothetical protein
MELKQCSKCGEHKTEAEFQRRADTGKLRNDCRMCRSKENLLRYQTNQSTKEAHSRASLKSYLKQRYGMTVEQYQKMFDEQGGKCAICQRPETVAKRLSVDHCHTTGKVRSLLCHNCNAGIGHFKENPEVLSEAITYLQRHS